MQRVRKYIHDWFSFVRRRPHVVGIGILALAAVAGVAIVSFAIRSPYVSVEQNDQKNGRNLSLADAANVIVATCADKPYRPSCYDDEIPKLMDYLTMEQTFEVTRMVQDKDHVYTYCHVLGHKLSARETAKDPSKWKDVITRAPSGLCSNGAIHGAFQERFRSESLTDEQIVKLKPELLDVCEDRGTWHPTGLEQASCYHALGHLVMYITSADTARATALCQDIAIKDGGRRDFRTLCYDGAFMQIFQPLEPEDFALVKGKQPTKETVQAFCSGFGTELRGPCWNESWPLFREEILTAKGLEKHCTNSLLQVQANIDRCFNALFYVTTAQQQFDTKVLEKFCSEFSSRWMNACFANASSRMIETDYRNIVPAVQLCTAAPSAAQNSCFEELVKYSTFNFHSGSPEQQSLCEHMPSPWKEKCLAHERQGS